ncbi:cilia- and flagella-associated protein 161 [Chanos chanos]|uniref:Cilia- and flagella-associated protein 161 n=1 Tax=Chanos chanos TaxID=29144 RepID=A0A6J2WRD2_CHACN|nr:cilia- and flagella-associated protein 161 [Chanos chanos]
MANVRTYRPSVRVGNWNEDVILEEDTLKDFLHRRERGELTVQRNGCLKQGLLKSVNLSVARDGFLHFGDVVMLVNPKGVDPHTRDACALSIIADINSIHQHPDPDSAPCLQGPCQVGGARSLDPCARNAFIISSVDGSPEGEMVKYEQCFALRTTADFTGQLFLASDITTFQKCALKSRLQEVSLVKQLDFLCWWRAVCRDPHERLEQQGFPVQVNSKVLISHCKTNQCLAALHNHTIWSVFGRDYEITAHTFLDSHKAEQDVNHWLFVTSDPSNQEQSLFTRQQETLTSDGKQDSQED